MCMQEVQIDELWVLVLYSLHGSLVRLTLLKRLKLKLQAEYMIDLHTLAIRFSDDRRLVSNQDETFLKKNMSDDPMN